jgi:hypothetical protein
MERGAAVALSLCLLVAVAIWAATFIFQRTVRVLVDVPAASSGKSISVSVQP